MLRAALRKPNSAHALVPADALLHPAVLVAIAALVLNDHLLKQSWPGLLTGKLSDFAGLAFFPLLLQAACEVASAVVNRRDVANQRVLLVAIAVTAIGFTAIKTLPLATDLYSSGLGLLQWLASAAPASVSGTWLAEARAVQATTDVSDLIAVPILVVPYLIGRARSRIDPLWS